MHECIERYRARNSYLAAMPEEALSERLVHLMNNCLALGADGRVRPRASDDPDMYTRLLDVLSEIGLRHGGMHTQPRDIWHHSRNVMVKPSAATAERARRLEAQLPTSDSLLFRFSAHRHMEELIEVGGLLMQQASTFKDQDNLSVRDDELALQFDRYVSEDEAATIPHIGPWMNQMGCRQISISLDCPDFLTLCMTDAINYRMISDWQAEAAVIIHNPSEFQARLTRAAAALLGDRGRMEYGRVHYIDPYFPLTSKDVAFCKHIKFAYQREVRFVLRDREATGFDERKLFLGPLKDIATLVDLR
jgi:hypothetical protein